MSAYEQIIKKIPGDIPPLPRKFTDGYVGELSKKQKFEILDLLQRQNKLLANKKFISKLPDKGEKIIRLKEKLEQEIKSREEVENAAELLSRLNIASEGKEAMSEIEWTGKYDPEKSVKKVVELDSDDEDDPLKIIAQPTGTGVHKKKIINLPAEETCIKPEDLEEIDPIELGHVNYIVDKVENPKIVNKERTFKPYKTTKSNVHDPEKEKLRGIKKKDLSAATPPAIVHSPAQTLDLKESLKLLQEQTLKLQEIQTKRTLERLMEKLNTDIPSSSLNYREPVEEPSDTSEDENEEYEEVHDDDDKDLGGTVTYSVENTMEN